MNNGSLARLTSAEFAQLWMQYMNDSGSICILSFFYEKAEDEEIKSLIKHSLSLSKSHIDKLTNIFTEEKHAIPEGFKVEKDVNLQAPRLYTDLYKLNFIHMMSKIGLANYSAAYTSTTRADITDYFRECMTETMELYKVSKELLLAKGFYIWPPQVSYSSEVEFVKSQKFLYDVIGEKRPLLVCEAENLFSNLQRNALGDATITGFSQVAQNEDVKEFFVKGIEIAKKHVRLFGDKLVESNLPVPTTWAAEITESTEFTFSDKLMMYFTSGMIGLSIGYYGTAVAQSPRVDLSVMYNRLSLEIQLYSEDGANIMIKNRWMEQPPMASNRSELAKKNLGE